MHEQNKKFDREIETIKTHMTQREILELKNAITKLKNSIESFKNRFNHTEERINHVEDRTLEITLTEEQKRKIMKKSEEISYGNYRTQRKKNNICFMEFQKKRERERKYT